MMHLHCTVCGQIGWTPPSIVSCSVERVGVLVPAEKRIDGLLKQGLVVHCCSCRWEGM